MRFPSNELRFQVCSSNSVLIVSDIFVFLLIHGLRLLGLGIVEVDKYKEVAVVSTPLTHQCISTWSRGRWTLRQCRHHRSGNWREIRENHRSPGSTAESDCNHCPRRLSYGRRNHIRKQIRVVIEQLLYDVAFGVSSSDALVSELLNTEYE